VTAEAHYEVTGEGYASEGQILHDGQSGAREPALEWMGRVSMLCNDAELRQESGIWKVEGDPTEGALYPFAAKLGLQRETEQAAFPRIDSIPFESEHKFMATLHAPPQGEQVLLIKGAPEVILNHCDRQEAKSGDPAGIDRDRWNRASDQLAAQ